jgi:hypothetical protein
MKHRVARSFVILAGLLAIPRPLAAQWWLEAQLSEQTPQPDAGLASAVDLDGETAVAGAPGDDTTATNAGAVHVFRRTPSGWMPEAKLYGSDPTNNDNVGVSVAVDGDTLVAGGDANGQAPTSGGEAYVFVRSGTTWSEQARLTGSLVTNGEWFGSSVAVQGDTLLVGAMKEGSPIVVRAGAVYVFERSGTAWAEQDILWARTPADGDEFGADLAIDGDTLVVGAARDDNTNGTAAGSAWVFLRSGTTWSDGLELLADDGTSGDQFGSSVGIDGDTIVVGARYDDPGGNAAAGSAYVFVRSGTSWTQQQKLTAANGQLDDRFGSAAAIEGDAVAIGALGDDVQGHNFAGSAYLFARSGTQWSQILHFKEPTPAPYNTFGTSVAMQGGRVLIGSAGYDQPGVPSGGTAYVYDDDPLFTLYCTAGTSASGCQATIGASGVPSATAVSGFVLSASGAEGAKSGNFIYGTGARQALSWGNGTSYRCFASPVMRGAIQNGTGTPGQCDGSYAEDLNARWCASCPRPNHNPGPGVTLRGQLWHRDPQSTSNRTSGFSDAVEWTLAL